MTDTDPARRYKEITSGMSDAVEDMRLRDAALARALEDRLVELQEQMEAAADAELHTLIGVELQWETALTELYHEQWMTMRTLPKQDPAVPPGRLDYLYDVTIQRFEALMEALRQRPPLGRR
ncbi:hypothetical protein [Pseudonocardia spinosispora]|uniref:hypothetical protein n=1 Tax=Pseudonocardia spinosispora TaxID=103441 RepID=UPI000414828E|nr:hypothetical protein [Pseudonocardia spinosispora]